MDEDEMKRRVERCIQEHKVRESEFEELRRTKLELFVSLLSAAFPNEYKLPLAALRAIDECPSHKLPGPTFDYLEPEPARGETLANFLDLAARTADHYYEAHAAVPPSFDPHVLDDGAVARFFTLIFQ